MIRAASAAGQVERDGESDYFLKRYAAARDGLRPYLDNASRRAEAKFFYLGAIRGLGDHVNGVGAVVPEGTQIEAGEQCELL